MKSLTSFNFEVASQTLKNSSILLRQQYVSDFRR